MTHYDVFCCIVAVVGGGIIGTAILWDLLQELRNGK